MSNTMRTLGLFKRLTKLDYGIGVYLPEAYKKFYTEWQLTEPTAVHYIPQKGKYKRNEVTGEVIPVQNVPIPLKFPEEHNEHIWGGEAVVQGFQKRDYYARRVPHFWIPTLKRSVVYSEVLDKYITVVLTDRAINLIHANYGFDHYLLKTLACDLKSLLALRLKRKILQELAGGCQTYAHNTDKQSEVLNHYKQYLSSYTSEEIEWYGYSFEEACKKMQQILEQQKKIVPLKHLYRANFIESLKDVQKAESVDVAASSSSWIQRINPFGKKHEA